VTGAVRVYLAYSPPHRLVREGSPGFSGRHHIGL